MNFNQLEILTIYRESEDNLYIAQPDAELVSGDEIIKSPEDHAFDSLRGAAEAFAENNTAHGLISSESALSERYDSLLEELHPNLTHAQIAVEFEQEDFSAWVDSLQKDGQLHASQYNAYEYVGKYSND